MSVEMLFAGFCYAIAGVGREILGDSELVKYFQHIIYIILSVSIVD